jgi:hypothetical protein
MYRPLKREVRREPHAYPVAVFVLGCFLLLVVLPSESAQIGSTTKPIQISGKEANDNLQVKVPPEYPPEAQAKELRGPCGFASSSTNAAMS